MHKLIKNTLRTVLFFMMFTGQLVAQQPYDLQEEKYEFTTPWKTQDAAEKMNRGSWATQVTYYRGVTYIVYVADVSENAGEKVLKPKIVKISAKGTKEVFLDKEDYKIPFDNHHEYSIGVDEEGYIHVTGDMHNYPRRSEKHLPERYQNGDIMYWKSDEPESIDSFTWLGDDTGVCPTGTGISYPTFFNDYHGKLFFTSRVFSRSSHGIGKKNCANLSAYNSSTGQWTEMGKAHSDIYDKQTIFLEDNGETFEPYMHYALVRAKAVADPANRIHIVTNHSQLE